MANKPIVELLAPVGQMCRQCPDQTLVLAYLDAVRQFCQQTRWLIGEVPMITVADQDVYQIGDDPQNDVIGITGIKIELASNNTRYLNQGKSEDWGLNDQTGEPCEFEYIPEAQFAIHRLPNAAYPLTVGIVLCPKRGANSIEPSLVLNWEFAFRAGALAYLLALPEVPWSNPREAIRQEAKFQDQINKGKSSVARGYNAGVIGSDGYGPKNSMLRSRMLPI